MKTECVKVEDIRNIALGGKLIAELPSYNACISAKNQVSYVRKAYPLPKGQVYKASINAEKNIITISVEEV